MYLSKHKLGCAAWLLLSVSATAMAHDHQALATAPAKKQAQAPHQRTELPPSTEQTRFGLTSARKLRTDLGITQTSKNSIASVTTPDCQDMNKLATYSGAALADYLVNLPDYECHYGLFSLNATQAATIYSAANMNAVASRFVQEANAYNATNIKLVNLLIYLRAGYYLASGNTIPDPAASVQTTLRPAIKKLANGTMLWKDNVAGSSTAGEALRLITNMHDEAYYLADMKAIVQRFTNTPSDSAPALPLLQNSASGGFTSALTVIYYAHYRPEGLAILQNDVSYAQALNTFVVNNKSALLGTSASFQLSDTLNEAYRFMQYPNLLPQIKPLVQSVLSNSSMTGIDSDLWLAAAQSVKYYDNTHCADYGTCNFETRLADAILKYSYTCSPTIRIRAQDMTQQQLQQSCDLLATEEGYFHTMLQTQRKPVAGDLNTSLELVVFDDYTNYNKYAGAIYGVSTNNGGIYLEGDPSNPSNQARFIAHEASWLRPVFQVWNLEHEYVHYLDGRFDMLGDFSASTAKPTVWWIEGIAEYISLKNNNQAAITEGLKATYPLSTIFGNTYDMPDYVNRAYRWGYLATRFMVEKHRPDVDKAVSYFRVGDYNSYQNYMTAIGSKYDGEFANWAKTVTTAGVPPLPTDNTLPACNTTSNQLGKNCNIRGLASSSNAYAYILLPTGAKNLRLFTSGGSGEMDLYVAKGRYPGTTSYDFASATSGNNESVSITSPTSGQWYYITLNAKTPFSGVTLNATYE